MKLIDKDSLLADIEKCVDRCNEKKRSCPVNTQVETICDNKINAYNEIISHLNTLEVKEVDLDYIKDELDRVVKIYKPDGDFGWGTLYNVATHFFELGLKAQKGLTV